MTSPEENLGYAFSNSSTRKIQEVVRDMVGCVESPRCHVIQGRY